MQHPPSPPTIPDDGIDLLHTAATLIRGWKTIVALMAVAGLVGLVAVSRIPSQYRANMTLRAVAPNRIDENSPIAGAWFRATNTVNPAVLQQYALLLRSDDNLLRRVAEAAGLGDLGDASLPTAVGIVVVKDSSEIQASVTLRDPAATERFAKAWMDQGLLSLAAARRRAIDATTSQLGARCDEARKRVCEKQRQLARLRHDRWLDEKAATIASLSQQQAAARETVRSSRLLIRALEARIGTWGGRPGTAPSAGRETRWADQVAEHCARLALRVNGSPLAVTGLETEVEPTTPAQPLPKDRVAEEEFDLRAMKRIVEEAASVALAIDRQITALKSRPDEADGELVLAVREAEWALIAYNATERSLADWKMDSEWRFPAMALDNSSPISVRLVGSSHVSRLSLLEVGALLLGCLVVLVRSSYRERLSRTSELALQEFGGGLPTLGGGLPRPGDRQSSPRQELDRQRAVA